MIRVGELFSKNHTVFIYGQEKYNHKDIHVCKKLEECIEKSDVIISSIPFSRDNVSVIAPYSEQEIKLEDIYTKLKYKTFIAGGIPQQFYEDKSIHNIDLLDYEELTILNAIPTVEGTIKIAIEETESTIHESNVMIFGYGRIGKILCKSFQNLGANVYCVARKDTDLAWVREERYIPVEYSEVPNEANKIDIIINTVPNPVIEEGTIKKLKENCLIIDIASNPGGLDKNIAKRYKIKVITALGIPGKIAPRTAAKYIKEVIEKTINLN